MTNRILTKFLINFLFLSFIYSVDNFENWLEYNKNKIFSESGLSKVSFNLKFNAFADFEGQQSDSCYVLLDVSNNIFQIKLFDNNIYHNKSRTDQYNILSNQLIRYDEDILVTGFIDMIISKDNFFNFSKYNYQPKSDSYIFTLNNLNLKFSMINNNINIDYQDSTYAINVSNLKIIEMTKIDFKNLLLYNMIDTTSIQIFNFKN